MVALCLGTSLGLAFTSVGALIAETVPSSSRGLAMGGYNTSIYLGMMTGSVVFGPIIEATTYAFGFLLAGVLNLFFIAAFFGLMRTYRPNPEGAPSMTP
jgi:MFS family permease